MTPPAAGGSTWGLPARPVRLSVSIVTFQQRDYVRQTLESVLAQETDFAFEVVVGDDASTDGTREILRDMAREHPERVRLLLPDVNYGDRGLSNFMATVDAARGEYIAFLDGDDYWSSPHKLQRQVDFLDRHPDCALCAHRAVHLLETGRTLLSPRPARGDRVFPIDRLIVSNFAEKLATMVRRSAMEQVPDWYRTTSAISADWLLNVLVGRAGTVGYVDEVLAVHRLHSDSQSMRHGTRRLLADKIGTLRMLREHLPGSRRALLRAERLIRLKLALLRALPAGYGMAKRLDSLRTQPRRARVIPLPPPPAPPG